MYLIFFSFSISPRDLRAPSADRRETLPRDRKYVQFYNPGPKMWGTLPPEKNGAKNVQNLGRFRTTNDLGSPVGGLGVMWPPQWVRDKARAASAFLCNLRSKIASDSDAFSYFHATFLVPAEGGGGSIKPFFVTDLGWKPNFIGHCKE